MSIPLRQGKGEKFVKKRLAGSLTHLLAKGRSVGGASVLASRAFNKIISPIPFGSSVASPHLLFADPNQVEDFAFERPVFDSLAEVFAERILLHVEPFVGVALAVAQAMVPAA